jgi:hypothetical protein
LITLTSSLPENRTYGSRIRLLYVFIPVVEQKCSFLLILSSHLVWLCPDLHQFRPEAFELPGNTYPLKTAFLFSSQGSSLGTSSLFVGREEQPIWLRMNWLLLVGAVLRVCA